MNTSKKMDRGVLDLQHKRYALKVVKRFCMIEAKKRYTPMNYDNNSYDDLDDVDPFRKAIGSLIYVAAESRPDIAYNVSTLTEFLEKHCAFYWTTLKRITFSAKERSSSS